MANRLKMAMVDTVQRLLEQGWSYRRIGRELGIHRDTVARLAGKSKPAKAPLGADGADGESKPAKAPLGADPLGQVVATLDAQAAAALSGASSSSASCLHSSQEKGHVCGSAARGAVDSPSACEPFRTVNLTTLPSDPLGHTIYHDLATNPTHPAR